MIYLYNIIAPTCRFAIIIMLYSDALMPNNNIIFFYYDLQEPIPTYNMQLQADNRTCKELGVEHPSSAYYKQDLFNLS